MNASFSRTAAVAVVGLAVLGLGTAVPATAAPAPAPYAGYTGSPAEAKANRAFFDAVLKSVAEKRAAHPDSAAAVTVVYDASRAPTFSAQISRSAQIWNSAVSNVKLQSGSSSNADFSYREGNDSRGSYASTDGHGSGYVFLDYAQNRQYDSTRVTAHETGHVLGLPDHYSGPCSELMSGGGPGPSCTNSQPDANERARVNQLWANGLAAALDKALSKS
ncbi:MULTISPECIES: snapalysin [Streptomyces]|uniref:Extracellular small neutral protease n=1 Tax=Streptomyces gilvifuscus TaxID=1550617 RepID=A0ABT5FXQ5_9ACTN|nr:MULTISPECIES: snapalysin [Streptomyces]MBK3646764.1 snapalysin [Streptomyces sp. MBT33]MDC2957298.1 snapalysin [Streptomyces gilvifuscus]